MPPIRLTDEQKQRVGFIYAEYPEYSDIIDQAIVGVGFEAFDPYEYAGYSSDPDADAYTKKTCIWSNFSAPVRKPVDPVLGSKMHLIGPGPDRQYLRSLTPEGFAVAVYEHLSEGADHQLSLW